MPYETLSFTGNTLRRGFWIYVWEVTAPDGYVHHYVGRTGDSSSLNAASPFLRVGRHLDSRTNAKANSLHKRLTDANLDPKTCSFHLHAVGPLFPEQTTREDHALHRNVLGRIEFELADRLRSTVIGNHQRPRTFDQTLFETTLALVLTELSPHLPTLIR